MSDKIRVRVTLTSETTRQVGWEVEAAEFAEWSGGKEPTGALVREFLQSHRDREEIEDSMWSLGKEVASTMGPFVEIERVSLNG